MMNIPTYRIATPNPCTLLFPDYTGLQVLDQHGLVTHTIPWDAIERPPKPKTKAELAQEVAETLDAYLPNAGRLSDWDRVTAKLQEWRNA